MEWSSMMKKTVFYILSACVLTATAWADDVEQGDMYIPSYVQPDINPNLLQSASDYTVIEDAAKYPQIVRDARSRMQSLMTELHTGSFQSTNEQIAFISQQLAGVPYKGVGAMGEGDWQPKSTVYQSGAVHVKQDPVYRIDGLDCQTFVQMAMALLYSTNLDEFDKNILKISYGAAGNPSGETVHYYNRNNFVDGDWNPINQRNGFLTDVTPKDATISVEITRQNWFLFQQKNLASTVRVLADADGAAMANRFMQTYGALNYPHFDTEHISMAYIPKEKIALKQTNGHYQPNQILLDSIPTPAVVEIVRDPKKWTIGGKNIKDVIGSELSISHMGLLYRHRFNFGDVIYQKITCSKDAQDQKVCSVKPVVCEQAQCNELMFVHATDARPNNYFWYQTKEGFTCTSKEPPSGVTSTKCNRIDQEPLFNYLTEYQYDAYPYMDSPSLVGVHIEKLN
jgi:hypothetical protein